MSKYFKDSEEWSITNSNKTGLPRPFFITPKKFYKKIKKDHNIKNFSSTDLLNLKNDFYLHPKIPIPWQSKPIFSEDWTVFNVISENEKKVFKEKLCGYCGIKLENNEQYIRWKPIFTIEETNDENGPRVFSDGHPMHIECMNQARIFCPYMRLRQDDEFEYGTYDTLIKNAEKWKSTFKNI